MTDDIKDGEENVTTVDFKTKTILGQGVVNETPDKTPTKAKQQFPLEQPMRKRRVYLIDTIDDTIEVEGFLGLTGSFLCIGDETGEIIFALAEGQWRCVMDVSNNKKRLKDYVVDTDDIPF